MLLRGILQILPGVRPFWSYGEFWRWHEFQRPLRRWPAMERAVVPGNQVDWSSLALARRTAQPRQHVEEQAITPLLK